MEGFDEYEIWPCNSLIWLWDPIAPIASDIDRIKINSDSLWHGLMNMRYEGFKSHCEIWLWAPIASIASEIDCIKINFIEGFDEYEIWPWIVNVYFPKYGAWVVFDPLVAVVDAIMRFM